MFKKLLILERTKTSNTEYTYKYYQYHLEQWHAIIKYRQLQTVREVYAPTYIYYIEL